ncbi:MAG TPA: polyphosphate kinase 1 [Candidatus Obscuribacterales bacterium]
MNYNQNMTSDSLTNRSEFESQASNPLSESPPVAEVETAVSYPSLDDPKLYINRELSLLAFQGRVLEEAQDHTNPLLERFKFLAIVGSNLEEFFMVRVAGLKRQVEAGTSSVGIDGHTPAEQLKLIRFEVSGLLQRASRTLKNDLLPALREQGISIVESSELTEAQRTRLREYFLRHIFPVLTPLGYDPGHPFPHISNLSLNLAVLIRDAEGEERFARVKVPDSLPQLIKVDEPAAIASKQTSQPRHQAYMWLDDVISANLDTLFPGMEIVESHPFHVTRDAEVEIQEWEAGDLLETTEQGIRQRRFGDVVRLQVNTGIPTRILEILVENLEIEPADIYWSEGRLPLSMLSHICSLDRPDLKYAPYLPAVPATLNPDTAQEEDVFSVIRRKDILLHHPYDSFQPVVNFVAQAVRDPNVLAIKVTLYRVGQNSPIVDALLRAPERGKQVACLVELKARFDEKSNIEWAKAMERQGVHVVYGLLGLKVHAKLALVIRREGDRIRRYVHLGTGNYNPVTAHLYTDFGLFTCDEELGSDVADLFNYLTGYSRKKDYLKLLVAPINLRDQIEKLIRREIEHHRNGKPGHLIFKANALVDGRIIKLLYEASQAGVKVDLIIRGICCLRPGIKDVSENIRVVSIVGRYLEHSRIYYFLNGGAEEIYIGSADLMERNLDRRVEVLAPIEDPKTARFIRDELIEAYLNDNTKARFMQSDGTYIRPPKSPDSPSQNVQQMFMERRTF